MMSRENHPRQIGFVPAHMVLKNREKALYQKGVRKKY
jgi:hypothetical protein